MQRIVTVLSVAVASLAAQVVLAETSVILKKSHVCCRRCETVVEEVLSKANVRGTANRQDGTIQFNAPDDAKAQKVLDDLAAAGFHGEVDSKTLKVKDDSGAKDAKVASLKLKGLHNCCGMCNTAIKKAIKSVDGVTADDAKVNSTTVTVTGDFNARALIKSLNDAGFHATVAE